MKETLFFVIMITFPALYKSTFPKNSSDLKLQLSSIMNIFSKPNKSINNMHYLHVDSLAKEMDIFKDFVEQTFSNMTSNEEDQNYKPNKKYNLGKDLKRGKISLPNEEYRNYESTEKYNSEKDFERQKTDNEQKIQKTKLLSTNLTQDPVKVKHINFRTNELDGLLDAIKRRILNITKIINKSSTLPTTLSSKVKLNHCFHRGQLCAIVILIPVV